MLKKLFVLVVLSIFSIASSAQDTYDPNTNQLYIPYVNVGTTSYTGVTITLGNVIEVKGGPAKFGADSFDLITNQLAIPKVNVNGLIYTNVKITIGQILGVSGQLTNSAVWDINSEMRWNGSSLEGAIDECKNRSLRWIAPIFADVNKDGVDDFLLPVSCYQGTDPAPNEKHNRKIASAWKLFCSNSQKKFYDCTQEKFGTSSISVSDSSFGGGNPYVHVAEKPFDINGDGFPDFWYALNRDDGRPGFDFNNPEDFNLLTKFCGPQGQNDWEWDCTRKSIQSVLLSRANGTYKVATLPWGATNTQAIIMLPNKQGSFDAFSFNYGKWKAARLVKEDFVDVSSEYASYKNIDLFGYVSPYVRSFSVEGVTYIAVPGAPKDSVNPDIVKQNGGDWGFTLWKWTPGVGFEVSDYWIPATSDTFEYLEKSGSSTIKKYGAYIRGHATYSPRWHFFRLTTLSPDEGPTLVVSQEAGTTAGKYFKAPKINGTVYSSYNYDATDNRTNYTELSPIEAFHIKNGKLIPRSKSVISGDAVWNVPSLLFEDLNGDGYMDAVGITGHAQHGQIFVNDGSGTLHKIYTNSVIPSLRNSNSAYKGGYGWTIRNFDSSSKLGFLYWGEGFSSLPSWAGSTHVVPDLVLLKGVVPFDALPIHSPEIMQSEIQTCLENKIWIDQCDLR